MDGCYSTLYSRCLEFHSFLQIWPSGILSASLRRILWILWIGSKIQKHKWYLSLDLVHFFLFPLSADFPIVTSSLLVCLIQRYEVVNCVFLDPKKIILKPFDVVRDSLRPFYNVWAWSISGFILWNITIVHTWANFIRLLVRTPFQPGVRTEGNDSSPLYSTQLPAGSHGG